MTVMMQHGDGQTMSVIQVRGLTKRYGSFKAVDDVSFEVRRGDVYGFLGPNGAGKSTTIGMLLGLVRPTSGAISLFGLPAGDLSDGLARVGGVIEAPAFYPYLSGADNLRALSNVRRDVTRERVNDVLETVGLSEAGGKKFGNYSMGMKQRLAIGWTLLHDPDLLILDEPTNGLDPAGMLEIRHLITQLAGEGKTIFISSHLLYEIEQICDRVAVINGGQIITEGEVESLLNQGSHLRIKTDAPEAATMLLSQMANIHKVEPVRDGVVVTAPDVASWEINAWLVGAGINVHELRIERGTLEDVFLQMTGANDREVAA